jgi:major vault protein
MGAISINVWTGYAVKVTDKTGAGRVEIGPKAFLLEYDETLEPMSLSTGKPKNTDKLFNTVYLKIKSNRVSDIIEVETIDMIKAKIKVSYRVDFINEDDPIKWFSVENYVKLLCDHARSIIKSVVRKITILDLHFNLTDIIRNSLLGIKEESTTKERLGMLFEENNMKVYDIEVLDLEITNIEINKMILDAERKVFSNVLTLKSKQHEATTSKELTLLNTQIIRDADEIEKARAESKSKKQVNEFTEACEDKKVKDALLAIENAQHKQNMEHLNEELKIHILRMQNEVEASTKIAYAFTPNMVQAINNLKDATVLESLSENFKDLAILQGQGILATATRFLDIIPQGLLDSLGKVKGIETE